MSVLILATDIYTRGGIGRYTSTLATALGQILGPENVDVLALLDWGSPAEVSKEFRVVEVVGKSVNPISKLRFGLKAARLGSRRYDLVIANHVALAPIAALIRFRYGSPFWVPCYGIEAWERLSPLKLAALKRAALVLPISQFTATKLREVNRIAPSRIRVLYNAIPAEFAALLTSPEGIGPLGPLRKGNERILLSVCNLVKTNRFKGIDTVIRALPHILPSVPSLRYVVVGEGELRPKLENLAAETGVAGHVSFVGEIPDAQLAALYRSCDVFVLASRPQQPNGNGGGEGFGRVYVEAALASKPVVGSRTGGAAEAVVHGKTGLLVDPCSVKEIADAVVTLMAKPDLAARMGSEGRERAKQNFSVEGLRVLLAELLRAQGLQGGK